MERKKFYVQLGEDNKVTDIIEYEYEGYVETELPVPLPPGSYGGEYQLVGSELVHRTDWAESDEVVIDYSQPIDIVKRQAVAKTKEWLSRELDKGMIWRDGKKYSITKEKQDLLAAQLLTGILQQTLVGANPADIVLRWNESGEEHTDWNYADLVALSSDIHAAVEPLVVRQQKSEKLINGAETAGEIERILSEFA